MQRAATAGAPKHTPDLGVVCTLAQVHAMARNALLAAYACFAQRPAAAALSALVAAAVRPEGATSPRGSGNNGSGGSGGRNSSVPAQEQLPPGWLLGPLQALITAASAVPGSANGGARSGGAGPRSPTPQRTPLLHAATPPPSPAPGTAGAAADAGGGACPATPERRAAIGAASALPQRRHAVQLAVSGLQTWGVVAQMLGAEMLRDKAAGQALLNVRAALRLHSAGSAGVAPPCGHAAERTARRGQPDPAPDTLHRE